VLAINGLRGIARTYRLAFLNGESEESSTVTATTMPGSVASSALPRAQGGPSSDGERALRNALQRLQVSTPAQPRVQGDVLIDLGDWYLTAGAGNRALSTYRDAWRALAPIGAQQSLETPVAIIYRAPPVAVSRQIEDPEKSEEQEVELRLGIKTDGDVRDVSVTNPAPEREAAERSVMAAVKRATWRPAFRDGEPVVATDVVFRERVYVRKPKVKE
jgi:TonB family protein